jgi:hypothetical protein
MPLTPFICEEIKILSYIFVSKNFPPDTFISHLETNS